jgi:hypothetical protein
MVDNEKKELFNQLEKLDTFVEVGVYQGKGIVDIAEAFPNASQCIGIDHFPAYVDEHNNYQVVGNIATDTIVAYEVSENQSKLNKEIALKRIAKSSAKDRIQLIELDSVSAARTFENNSVDAIFLDAYTNEDRAVEDVIAWHPKVSKGGILCGQEWNLQKSIVPKIQEALNSLNSKASIQKINTLWYIVKE